MQEKLKVLSQRLTFLYYNEEFCLEFNDVLHLEFVFKVTTCFRLIIGHYWVNENIKLPIFSWCKKTIAQCPFGRSECSKNIVQMKSVKSLWNSSYEQTLKTHCFLQYFALQLKRFWPLIEELDLLTWKCIKVVPLYKNCVSYLFSHTEFF